MYDEKTNDRKIYFDCFFVTHMVHVQCTDGRGVDNGAVGAATAAPIIWLVVVIQK